MVHREGKRQHGPIPSGEARGLGAEDQGHGVVWDHRKRREEDRRRTGREEKPDLPVRPMRARAADEQLPRLHTIPPSLAEVWTREGTPAMEDPHGGVVDDVWHEALDQRRILTDVADRLVESGKSAAADEEVHERDVARRMDRKDAGPVFVTDDPAADT